MPPFTTCVIIEEDPDKAVFLDNLFARAFRDTVIAGFARAAGAMAYLEWRNPSPVGLTLLVLGTGTLVSEKQQLMKHYFRLSEPVKKRVVVILLSEQDTFREVKLKSPVCCTTESSPEPLSIATMHKLAERYRYGSRALASSGENETELPLLQPSPKRNRFFSWLRRLFR